MSAEPVSVPLAEENGGYLQYRAIYDYAARNEDELSFAVNDIIQVRK